MSTLTSVGPDAALPDSAWPIFRFESDVAGALQCMPMSVRFRLDECGVKLSLKQWNRLPEEQRQALVSTLCDTPERVQAYRGLLTTLIETYAASAPEFIAVDPAPPWSDTSRVPTQIQAYAASLGCKAPDLSQWQALSPLQRFVLCKLSRPNHQNANFMAAMQEFGLTD
jgi:hypothetical protein